MIEFKMPFEASDTEPKEHKKIGHKRLDWPKITRKPKFILPYLLKQRVEELQAQIRRGSKILPSPNHAGLNHSRILRIRR